MISILKNISCCYSINISLIKCFKKKRPIFLWGPPGIGKSDLVDQVTTELGGKVFDLRLAQMDPTDLRGIPYYNKAKNLMDWAPPIDLPDEAEAKKEKLD